MFSIVAQPRSGGISPWTNIKKLRAENAQLEIALDAAIEESKRLARELVDAEATVRVLAALLRELVATHREGEDQTPIIQQVGETLKQIRQEQELCRKSCSVRTWSDRIFLSDYPRSST